ncbi:MAG TPA: aminotransferase class V-fold PLP-dependent enzyme, partial [Herpetosiphonaceae bacterium]
EVVWNDAPQRFEAGTPNVAGAIALAAALNTLAAVGLERIAAHERELTARLLRLLDGLDGVRVYGDSDPARAGERLGIVPFAVRGMDHGLAAAILSAEHGIAVRNGSFCAQPYVRALLGGGDVGCGARRDASAGLVRASIGLHTTAEDIDALAGALESISRGRYRGDYELRDGAYRPRGWSPPLDDYLALACPALFPAPALR